MDFLLTVLGLVCIGFSAELPPLLPSSSWELIVPFPLLSSSRCPNGDYCSNRRFQKKQHADVEVILTEKKGWGLRAAKDLPS